VIRAMVVDDELLARQKLKSFLSSVEDIHLVAEADNGYTAIEAIHVANPDLLFLDIEMPGPSAFDLLNQAVDCTRTCLIFTTAYVRHAVRAFEAEATDFLLKPFDEERFKKSLAKARRFLEARKPLPREEVIAASATADLAYVDQRNRFVARSGGKIIFLKPNEIIWIEAAANYVRLNVRGGQSYLIRQTMHEIEHKLDVNMFLRIHRSVIVNIERVRELQPCGGGEYIVMLQDGKQLPLGRSFRPRMEQLLAQML
jgi:two-component system LytT family response regulator